MNNTNNVYQKESKIIEESNNEIENENEDFENDVYLIELHKRLINMKKERQKAEQDEKLLYNRLNLLKGEEEKVINYTNN